MSARISGQTPCSAGIPIAHPRITPGLTHGAIGVMPNSSATGSGTRVIPMVWTCGYCAITAMSAYSIDRGQRFQAIVDSAVRSAATAADAFRVSTMSSRCDDFSVVGATFRSAFCVGPRAVQRKGLAQGLALGLQLDPVAVMHDSVQDGIGQSGLSEVGVPGVDR